METLFKKFYENHVEIGMEFNMAALVAASFDYELAYKLIDMWRKNF